MIIKEIAQQVAGSTHPVARAIHQGPHCKALAIAFTKGMRLKDHKTALPATLIVLSGTVVYQEGDLQKELGQYDTTDIPVGVVHAVDCTADAICLLIQG
jgi:quercetin dioxygenase-like cupin family protein